MTWIALATVLLAVVVMFARFYVFVGAPSFREAEAVVAGELIAWDADERLAVSRAHGLVFIDRVVVDRSPYLDFPMLPRWRQTGDSFYVPARAADLASAGIAPSRLGCGRCHDRSSSGAVILSGAVIVFGQVTSGEVAFLAHQTSSGAWERHSVDGLGFIISDANVVAGGEIRLRLLRADGSQIGEAIAVQAGG